MACIRMELAVKRLNNELNVYDCLVEEVQDFSDDESLDACGIGSMAYCLEDGNVYAKTESGWGAVE